VGEVTTLATALTLAGAYTWWRLGPDWREHIVGIALDVIRNRY
jgi:hypothetical protein